MKRVDFTFIGKSKNKAYHELEEAYHKKVSRYVTSSLIHLKDNVDKNISVRQTKETQDLIKSLGQGDVLVICDERGKEFDSQTFSKQVEKWMVMGQRVVFAVGGAYGWDQKLIPANAQVIRLSKLVMPHELARTVLLEQVYRAFTLIGNEKYHH